MIITPLGAIWLTVCINSFLPVMGYLTAGRMSPPLFALCGSALGFACFLPWVLRHGMFPVYFRRDLWPRLLAIGFFGSALPIAALVLAGTLLIAFKERFTMRWTGDLIVLAVPLMYQVSHLFSKRLPRDLDHVFVASARTLFATLGILPVFALGFFMPVASFAPSLELLGIMLVWGLVLTALNNVLWYKAILNMDLSKATAIVLSYPVLTALISHTLGIEKIQAYQLIGLGLALTGAYWVTRLVRRQHAA